MFARYHLITAGIFRMKTRVIYLFIALLVPEMLVIQAMYSIVYSECKILYNILSF